VHYFERPSDEQVNRLLNEATILLQTSKQEGFCLPPLEAMAAGAVAVCTDANGNRDFCRDDENCLAPATRSASALASAIPRVLVDSELRSLLIREGRRTAAEFAWPGKLDELDRRYRAIAAEAAMCRASLGGRESTHPDEVLTDGGSPRQ
jgi:glycosyltransferase involved in cell wall biosynthesis